MIWKGVNPCFPFFQSVLNNEVVEKMQLELQRLQWQHKQEIIEIKHNTGKYIEINLKSTMSTETYLRFAQSSN